MRKNVRGLLLVAVLLALSLIAFAEEVPTMKDWGLPGPALMVTSATALDTVYLTPTVVTYRTTSGTSTKQVREGRDAKFFFAEAKAPWRYKAYGALGTDAAWQPVDSVRCNASVSAVTSYSGPKRPCWILLNAAGLDSITVGGITGTDTVWTRTFY